jgi:hypothetical protein
MKPIIFDVHRLSPNLERGPLNFIPSHSIPHSVRSILFHPFRLSPSSARFQLSTPPSSSSPSSQLSAPPAQCYSVLFSRPRYSLNFIPSLSIVDVVRSILPLPFRLSTSFAQFCPFPFGCPHRSLNLIRSPPIRSIFQPRSIHFPVARFFSRLHSRAC